jgi:putative oxidoreductase
MGKVAVSGGAMKFLDGLRPVGLLVLRAALGLIFLYHGYPKLVHADPGLRAAFVQHGMPGYFVGLAGIIETFGAALLFLGLFTRPAALILTAEMAVAIWRVHSGHGIMVVKEYEFPMVVGAACFALTTVGAGLASLDHLIFGEGAKRRRGGKSWKE